MSEHMIERKRWRVYYNCRDHFPHLVAVDNGSIASQIRVQWVAMWKCMSIAGNSDMGWPRTAHPEIAARKGKPNEPTWWLELEAFAVFENGGVKFYGERER
jgi:hypothetical protein